MICRVLENFKPKIETFLDQDLHETQVSEVVRLRLRLGRECDFQVFETKIAQEKKTFLGDPDMGKGIFCP